MRWGIFLTAIGIACYIMHAILLNYYLRKNAPEILERDTHAPSQRQGRVHLVGDTEVPRWVILLGLPAIPLFLTGIVLLAVLFIIKVLR